MMSIAELPPLPETMRAARLHEIGEPLKIDTIALPELRGSDVLVEVKACGVVPNMRRVMANYFGTQTSDRKLFPDLPAIFGLDPVGVVARVGEFVTGVKPGDRVYVNPARSCNSCRMCRIGRPLDCATFTFQGYFGRSKALMDAYPYGGFSQFITAPPTALVKLPDAVSFEDASRLGYIGTAYSGLKKIGFGIGDTLLINGISGTLGLSAVMSALAMGAARIFGIGRNVELLERVRAIAPDRIFVHSMEDASTPGEDEENPLLTWIKSVNDGVGVDAVIDCLPPGAPPSTMEQSIGALRRGGRLVTVGAVTDAIAVNAFWVTANRIGIEGSVWFTTAEGEELVGLAAAGALDLSVFDHRLRPLNAINETLDEMPTNTDGGFANYIIDHRQ